MILFSVVFPKRFHDESTLYDATIPVTRINITMTTSMMEFPCLFIIYWIAASPDVTAPVDATGAGAGLLIIVNACSYNFFP